MDPDLKQFLVEVADARVTLGDIKTQDDLERVVRQIIVAARNALYREEHKR